MKRTSDDFDLRFEDDEEPCLECGALPGQDHKGWCVLGEADEDGAVDESGDLFPS